MSSSALQQGEQESDTGGMGTLYTTETRSKSTQRIDQILFPVPPVAIHFTTPRVRKILEKGTYIRPDGSVHSSVVFEDDDGAWCV